eukprot:11204660-Alexandrium_andersonii.AAC.1
MMSLRCWTCGGRWPGAWGFLLRRSCPPAFGPQSNGSDEDAVRQLKGLIRTLMLAPQERSQGE